MGGGKPSCVRNEVLLCDGSLRLRPCTLRQNQLDDRSLRLLAVLCFLQQRLVHALSDSPSAQSTQLQLEQLGTKRRCRRVCFSRP